MKVCEMRQRFGEAQLSKVVVLVWRSGPTCSAQGVSPYTKVAHVIICSLDFHWVLMTRLWKNWELMSHHEYSYQVSGVPLSLISKHQRGVSGPTYDWCWFTTNSPYPKARLSNKLQSSQLWCQKSFWEVIYSRHHFWNVQGRSCSLEVTVERCTLLPWLSYFQLCCGRASKGNTSESCPGKFPHRGQDSPVLPGLGDVCGLTPKGSCSVEIETFLTGLFPGKYNTELMLGETPAFQGAAEWTDV